jgi:hypothetical protein
MSSNKIVYLSKNNHPLFSTDIDNSDHLSNSEYKTYKAEPYYSLLVTFFRILPKEIIRLILKYYKEPTINLTGRTLRRLKNTIHNKSFSEFKNIYDMEYVHDENIFNYFEFCDKPPCPDLNFYKFCVCRHSSSPNDVEHWVNEKICIPMQKISRYNYTKECMCPNGKRYLAYKMIYDNIDINEKYMENYDLMINHVIESGPIYLHYYPFIENENNFEIEIE